MGIQLNKILDQYLSSYKARGNGGGGGGSLRYWLTAGQGPAVPVAGT